MMAGLLGGISEISAIMQEQGSCDWDEARRLWLLSMGADSDRQPDCVFMEAPLSIAARVGQQMGVSLEEALDQMQAIDCEAMCMFRLGNTVSKLMVN